MYEPSVLVSPLSTVVDVIRRENNETYSLLLTNTNVEVVGIESSFGLYNTAAVVNELDLEGQVIKLGRVVEYNRIDLAKFIRDNTDLIVGKNNVASHHLLSYRDEFTVRNPTAPHVSQVLNLHYNLPINPIDLKVISQYNINSPFSSDTLPVDSSTYPKIVNGTIENTLYTYTGGLVPVSHRTVYPATTIGEDTAMALGLQVIKSSVSKETMELTLPLIDGDDSWTIMFESMLIAQTEKKGNLWFKLTLNTADNTWIFHYNDTTPIRFTGGYLVTVRILKVGNVITVEGEDTSGNKTSTSFVGPLELITDELQRVTAYTSNPLPRVLQFKLKSSTDNTLVTEADTLSADPLSNGLYSTTNIPIIITDSVCSNYVEDDIDRYDSRYDNITTGSVTRLTQHNNDTYSTVDVTITNFNNLCLNGIFKKLSITVSSIANPVDDVRVDYEIINTDYINKTARVIITVNGVSQPDKTIPMYNLSGMFKVLNDANEIKISSADEVLSTSLVTLSEIAPYQYRIKFEVELNAISSVPTMTFNKTITPMVNS